MKLSRKIFLSFMVMLFMIFTLGGAGVFYLKNNNENVEDISSLQSVVFAYDDLAFQSVRANAAIRGYIIYKEDYMKENHYEIRDTIHSVLDQLKELGVDQGELTQYVTKLEAWETSIDNEIIPLLENGADEEAKDVAEPILGKGSTELVVFAKEMATAQNEAITNDFNKIVADGKKMFVTVIIVSVIALIVAILLSFVFGTRLSRSINEVIEKVNIFATGDFTVKLNLKSNDEFGELSNSFNEMTETLRQTISNVSLSSSQVAAMSEEYSASSEEVSQAADEITNAIMDISEGIEDQNTMTSNVRSVANHVLTEMRDILENVDLTKQRVENTDQLSEEGQKEVMEVNEQMSVMLTNSEQITEDINELSNQITTITNSIMVIKEISEQTNLLALNASIEASRAGENGQGFAVVAEEVRRLAEESKEASLSIEEMVQDISIQIKNTVALIDNNNESVRSGQNKVVSNAEVFDKIIQAISNVKTETDDVQKSTESIYKDMDDLFRDIEKTNEISKQSNERTHSIAAASEEQNASMLEVAEASSELSKLATNLQNSIQNYKY